MIDSPEIETTENLDEILNNQSHKTIFLGNGFNLSLGVKTSYQSIYNALIKHDYVKDMLKEEIQTKIEDNGFNLEAIQDEISEDYIKAIMTKFYEIVLGKCRVRYDNKSAVDFLLNFSKYYTTNYDPLLYRFLLEKKKDSDINTKSDFYNDLKEIHAGNIDIGEFEKKPLKAVSKKMVYELASGIFKESGVHVEKKRDDYFRILKHIRKEAVISVNDGFVINPPRKESGQYMVWNFNEQPEQSIFYLHGALHIYKDDRKVKKLILNKNSHDVDFINEINKKYVENSHSCVFQTTSAQKLEKIRKNSYLENCLRKLSKVKDSLFIIGWSCSENDQHIVDTIKKSPSSHLYISYHDQALKSRYQECFPEKNLTFFNAKILPFSRKSPQVRTKNSSESESMLPDF